MKNVMENTIVNKTSLVDCLVYNNRFSKGMLTAAQIGAEDLATWENAVKRLWACAYDVYAGQENHVDITEQENAMFSELRNVLALVGELTLHDVNGTPKNVPIMIDDAFVKALGSLVSNYAGRIGKKKAPALMLAESQKNNAKKLLEQYSQINGVEPSTIKALEEEIEKHKATIAELMAQPDMCIDQPTAANAATFRKHFEHHLARVIVGQKAQTFEEYKAAKDAKKAERKQRDKENRQKKAAAKKSAK